MSQIIYKDRTKANSRKFSGLKDKFGRDDLIPLWIADMDFEIAPAITKRLLDVAGKGAFGYQFLSDEYYDAIKLLSDEEAYFLVGGLSTFSRLCNSIGQDVVPTTPAYFTNPVTINITGGKIVELYGTPQKENLNTKGDAYIYVSGGYIQNFYGGKEGSTLANGDEKGDINIITYGGIIDVL